MPETERKRKAAERLLEAPSMTAPAANDLVTELDDLRDRRGQEVDGHA